jgi:hypothetical protein
MFRNQTKEDFCPLCIAPIILLAGGGAVSAGVLTNEEKRAKKRKILIWTGLSIIITVITIYIYMRMSGGCKTCTIKLP